MLRLALAAALALPLSVRAELPRAEGRIETDEGSVEILGRPVRVGERVDLPEGWFRVEEIGTEDGEVGSFAVVPVETFDASAPAVTGTAEAGDPAPSRPRARDCRAERSAYLAELWRQSGIEFSSPAALIDGLEGRVASGPALGFYWFARQTDPFRPLAWSSNLRDRAEALARCVRGD
jgi:hypothetical protein